MIRTARFVFTGLVLAGLALSLRVALAQEHPGQPRVREPAKKDERPTKPEAQPVTLDELARAIQSYAQEDTRLKGGYFLVYDARDKKPLVLTFDKVHKDKLAEVEKGAYFACVDFKSSDGVTYDLDLFMKQAEHGLKCNEIDVHKVAGKPRYEWYQDKKDSLWKRRPASTAP